MDKLRGSDYVKRIETLCIILRGYRVQAGLTQSELAKELGIAQTKVSKIELRERRLDVVEMTAYLAPLGKTLIDLATDMTLEAERERVGTVDRSLTLIAADSSVDEGDVVGVIQEVVEAAGMEFDVDDIVGRADSLGDGRESWGVDTLLIPVSVRDEVVEQLEADFRWEVV
ncbi:helix-turn-helix transcriptional regulator [Gordonia sp. MP11Mi]|uniref:HTH cro/C1-type domain-containing protein n=1 Tax=Gordonia sp. MP11Mi TaxID=3022769 RepID=A0AA97GU00_9ACTN